MEPVNLKDAVSLYRFLKGHIPENIEDELEFIHAIVKSMNANEYVQSIMLMTNKSLKELATMEPEQILELFILGLSVNKVISLAGYMQGLGL